MNALVKDVMTTRVIWVQQQTPFDEVAAALREYRVSAFPVVGRPSTIAQGHEIAREARHVQGVVAVRDRFEYPDPGPDGFDVAAGFVVG